jgi:hypothetical protein
VQAAKQDFGNGIPIMKWITSQRNSNGGFASTQVFTTFIDIIHKKKKIESKQFKIACSWTILKVQAAFHAPSSD